MLPVMSAVAVQLHGHLLVCGLAVEALHAQPEATLHFADTSAWLYSNCPAGFAAHGMHAVGQ
jgi:hypothetical protein